MPFWQRSLITLVAMMAISFLVGLLWNSLFCIIKCFAVFDSIGGCGFNEIKEEGFVIYFIVKLHKLF